MALVRDFGASHKIYKFIVIDVFVSQRKFVLLTDGEKSFTRAGLRGINSTMSTCVHLKYLLVNFLGPTRLLLFASI